ncbi:MAG: SpoIIE family protein phosphatase [Pseudomonadota bacterium]
MSSADTPKVQVPFALKIGMAICVLTGVLLGGCVLYFFQSTESIIIDQMRNRLRDIGQTGAYAFDRSMREKIIGLRERLLVATAPRHPATWPGEGEFEPQLEDAIAEEFHQDEDFLALVQLLRRIKAGSTPRITTDEELPQIFPDDNQPYIAFAYLMTPIPESPDYQVLMTIADSDFQTYDQNLNGVIEPEEEGNPAGSFYRIAEELFSQAIATGQSHTAQEWYTDQWGTFLSAGIPIFDTQNQVIAVMGLDLQVQSQANRLNELRRLSFVILAVGLIVSFLIALWLARVFSNPVRRIMRASLAVKDHDFSAKVELNNRDELGVLAWAFNQMVDELADYSHNLQGLVKDRTVELEAANETIRRINEDLTVENLRLGAEVKVARKLQMMVLPSQREMNLVRGLDIAGYMDPADEVGGDYYDVLMSDEGYAKLGIGDVCGHGLESGVVMLMVQTAVRTALYTGINKPETLYAVINRVIFRNLGRIQSDKSMTLSLIDYFADGRLVVTGQHEEMIVVRADGGVERIDTMELGLPIGIDEHIDDFVSSTQLRLRKNDILLLHTDGITEAENETGDQFTIERLVDLAHRNHDQSVGQIVRVIIDEVRGFMGKREVLDDLTLVVVKKKDNPSGMTGQWRFGKI